MRREGWISPAVIATFVLWFIVDPLSRRPLHTEHDIKGGGLWDGHDKRNGERISGMDRYGICKRCGSRWARRNEDPPYVTTEDEWARNVTLLDHDYQWAKGHDPLL